MPAPAFQQGNSAAAASALTVGVTYVFSFPSNTLAGSLLVFAVRTQNTGNLVSVTDTQTSPANTWNVFNVTAGGGNPLSYAYAVNTKGGPCTVTATFTTSASASVSPVWAEYINVSAFRAGDGGAGGNSTNATTGAVASLAGDLLIAMECGAAGTATASLTGAGNTPTAREKSSVGGNSYCAIADGISAGGTLAGSFASISTMWNAGLLVFSPAGAGGGSKSWLTVAAANALRGLRH